MEKSNFVRILCEICAEQGIGLESFSYDWAHRLKKGGETRYIVGYQFPLNNAAAKELCQDKALTYGLLHDAGLPAVPHLFLPSGGEYSGMDRSDFRSIARRMLGADGRLVVKDNSGTGGNRVFLVGSEAEFDAALDQIFLSSYGAALSPYVPIEEEYRVIMLGEEPLLVFRKQRPFVTGDGVRTLRELAEAEKLSERLLKNRAEAELASVPEKGERVFLSWKHNLGQGSRGIIEAQPERLPELLGLAVRAVRVLGTGFVSVDIVRSAGSYQILEINGGVMMEHLAGQDESCYRAAKAVYARAIRKMFGCE